MPELYVEFTDEDEDGTYGTPAAQNVQDERKRSSSFFFTFVPS